ncbi:hypothetical protein BGZ63DRAFT_381304 [Mariannaea sp. PMI_226]|nr:hypothetical protein BGZ63DRAFT_381304 [Mariannaea sp. PMI_226]
MMVGSLSMLLLLIDESFSALSRSPFCDSELTTLLGSGGMMMTVRYLSNNSFHTAVVLDNCKNQIHDLDRLFLRRANFLDQLELSPRGPQQGINRYNHFAFLSWAFVWYT